MAGRPAAIEPTVVIDIGGGSTEFVVGTGRSAGFHVSTPAGVVRMSERHIHERPAQQRASCRRCARTRARCSSSTCPRRSARRSSAGSPSRAPPPRRPRSRWSSTPTTPARVHGHKLLLATVELLEARLAEMTEAQRREVVGLHPDRAPTIVAGMILLSRGDERDGPRAGRGLRARHPLRRRAQAGQTAPATLDRAWRHPAAGRYDAGNPPNQKLQARFDLRG